MRSVAITGASGLLGSALSRSLQLDGITVIRIGRGERNDVQWDPDAGTLDGTPLEGVDAVVHLAGENIAQRWTAATKRAIRDSRVQGTALIARTLAGLARKPRALLSGSAAGIYGAQRGAEILTEASSLGTDFLAAVARDWEHAAEPARAAGIRVVYSRTGVVLDPAGGMLQRILPVFKLGGGGRLGSGRQWLSWISRSDWVRAMRFLLDAGVGGPFNLASPNPVTNAVFTDTLGSVLQRPTLMVVPEFAIRLAFGEMGEATVLASQRMLPERLLAEGFRFEHAELAPALRHELSKR